MTSPTLHSALSTLHSPPSPARRWFFQECGVGLGAIALQSLLGGNGSNSAVAAPAFADPMAPKQPHFAPKAKRVIYLFMAGAPSHLEMFDNKPKLAEMDGKLPPPELLKGYRAAFINPNSKFLGPKFKFAKHIHDGCCISLQLASLKNPMLCYCSSLRISTFQSRSPYYLMGWKTSPSSPRPAAKGPSIESGES